MNWHRVITYYAHEKKKKKLAIYVTTNTLHA